ncbi:MAG: hypothetical protein M3O61_08945 [Gemmatimonadota bacterium]|nr:hypothetical protein [Gemmatimonadota bacterium]
MRNPRYLYCTECKLDGIWLPARYFDQLPAAKKWLPMRSRGVGKRDGRG